jgi:hypothetical protein
MRSPTGWFSPGLINSIFEDLRVPRPGNSSQTLSQLARRGLVMRRREGGWTLTPRGEARVTQLIGSLDADRLDDRSRKLPGVEYGNAFHTVIPPTFAPARWLRGIARLLERSPFESNVFLMLRYPRSRPDPIAEAATLATTTLNLHGLNTYRADDRTLEDELHPNVAAYMWGCQFGVAIFEDRVGEGLNPNVVLEAGSMLMTGRRCALLKDRSLKHMPTDLVGHLYKEVDLDDATSVSSALHHWVAEDLALGKCKDCGDTR